MSFTDIGKSCTTCEFNTIHEIIFYRKFPNLHYTWSSRSVLKFHIGMRMKTYSSCCSLGDFVVVLAYLPDMVLVWQRSGPIHIFKEV